MGNQARQTEVVLLFDLFWIRNSIHDMMIRISDRWSIVAVQQQTIISSSVSPKTASRSQSKIDFIRGLLCFRRMWQNVKMISDEKIQTDKSDAVTEKLSDFMWIFIFKSALFSKHDKIKQTVNSVWLWK